MIKQRNNPLVVVSGNIGVGKTSLSQSLAMQHSWRLGLESVADNPYLVDFYCDMEKWVFHLAIYNLGNRVKQYLQFITRDSGVVIDRSIYEDKEVFIQLFRDTGIMSENDFKSYSTMWELVASKMPIPNVLVYLKAPPAILLERIHSRNRAAESTITLDYLTTLDHYYQRWVTDFHLCPVVVVDASKNDFLEIERIQDVAELIKISL